MLVYKFASVYLKIITCDLSTFTMDHSKFIVSNQKEESINTQRVSQGSLYLRYSYDTEIEPVPGISKIRERIKYKPTGQHLDYRFYCVDTSKHIPK